MEIVNILIEKKEALLFLAFVILLFKEQIGKLLPEIVRAKFGIKQKESEALTTITLSQINVESGGAIRSVTYTWPEMALVGETEQFQNWLLEVTNRQRVRYERMTMNLVMIRSVNTKFVQGWKSAILQILRDNSICMLIVFPKKENISAQIADLKDYIEDEVKQSGKSSITVREDNRAVN